MANERRDKLLRLSAELADERARVARPLAELDHAGGWVNALDSE